MKSSPLTRWLLPVVAALLMVPAQADEAEDRGLAIAQEADRRDSGFVDNEAALTMILHGPGGQSSRRSLRIRILESTDPDMGDKSLVVFDEPRDIAGTALLSHTRILDPDDQWVWLPEVARVKRISGTNRSGAFMGSEFAYEDLAAPEVAKFAYRYLRDEPCGDNLTCHVVERRPLYADTGYSRQEVWLDAEEFRPWKITFHDRRGDHFKTLEYADFHQYGKFWRAHRMVMTNHRNGRSTELVASGYRFGVGFTESDFSQASLRRVR